MQLLGKIILILLFSFLGIQTSAGLCKNNFIIFKYQEESYKVETNSFISVLGRFGIIHTDFISYHSEPGGYIECQSKDFGYSKEWKYTYLSHIDKIKIFLSFSIILYLLYWVYYYLKKGSKYKSFYYYKK